MTGWTSGMAFHMVSECFCSAHSLLFIKFRILAQGMVAPKVDRSSHFNNLTMGVPHRYTWRAVSKVSPDFIKFN